MQQKTRTLLHPGFLVREKRLELSRQLTHAPQTCLSTYSSTLAYFVFALTLKAGLIIADKTKMSSTFFKFFYFFRKRENHAENA